MTTATIEMIVQNLRIVLQNIRETSAKCATTNCSSDIRLVAVSKTFPAELVWACYSSEIAQRHFGENYADELATKAQELEDRGASEIRWHYIGRLQKNKIKKLCATPNLWCVESISKQKHSDLLQEAIASQRAARTLNVFIQVNTSGETNKNGAEPEEVQNIAKHIVDKCPNLTLMGLMTIGSFTESKKGDENVDFEVLKRLRDQLEPELQRRLELSMGMSADYTLAIKYGSTNVRVGSIIFGQRMYSVK